MLEKITDKGVSMKKIIACLLLCINMYALENVISNEMWDDFEANYIKDIDINKNMEFNECIEKVEDALYNFVKDKVELNFLVWLQFKEASDTICKSDKYSK